ncbi:MAG TPA: hypothetical protein VF258_10235 [Luteolibacter sp.]
MKLRLLLPVALLCLASFSCDKVKNIATKARSAVEDKLAKSGETSLDSTPDPELQKLVDQTPEGVIFRKDLPLPDKFEVKITRTQEISGRFTQTSAIENQAGMVKGTQTLVTKFERSGELVRYTLEQSTFADPVVQGADESKKPAVKQLAPPSKARTFKKTGGVWKSDDGGDFRTAALAQLLAPVFDELLVENALALRPLWFGKKRFKIGDQLTVTDQLLPMLVAGNPKGSLTLTLVAIEPVKGHPCGVFSITGSYNRKRIPDFEGSLTDEDVTIESGKLWLSLLYPLVIKEEADTIQTTHSGGQGNASKTGQGSVKLSVVREWKKTTP